MTIASFHRQLEFGAAFPLLQQLNALRNPGALRLQLDSPSDQAYRYWFIWP